MGVVTGGTEQFRFGSNPIPGANKNLLINGSMAIAQRGSQTGQGGSAAYSACDRWFALGEGSPQGRVTTTQTADTGMNLNGHEYTLKVDCTTAEDAVGAAEGFTIQQKIEAQNLQGLKYGTANAETVTLSFWFSSPKNRHPLCRYLLIRYRLRSSQRVHNRISQYMGIFCPNVFGKYIK